MPEFINSTVTVTITVELTTDTGRGWTFTQTSTPVKFDTGSDPAGATVDDAIRGAANECIEHRPPAPTFPVRRKGVHDAR